MKMKHGVSLVEVLVAIAVMSLAIIPLTGLLSSSNRMSNASVYEEMAVHYARELADQLLNLTPRFPALVDEARVITGGSNLDLAAILNDNGFASRIMQPGGGTGFAALEANGRQLPVTLMLSPLDEAFFRRRITATPLDCSGNRLFKNAKFWKVTIELAWNDRTAGLASHREVTTVIFLREG
mgnify:CR=1 FL=1